MGENTIVESGTSPRHSRVAGFWPTNTHGMEAIEVAMADSGTHSKGDLVVGNSGGWVVDAAAGLFASTVVGVVVADGGSATADANDNVKLLVYPFNQCWDKLWWVIASTGTAGVADFARLSDIDGADGISVSGRPADGSGEIGFRIMQIDDTHDVCLGYFTIA